MTKRQHLEDIVVRSVKTFLAAFTATLAAGGINVAHLTISKQLGIAALAAGVTAVLNAVLKVHYAISVTPTPSSPTPVTPPAPEA